jgi:hypothetical protein
MINIRFAPAIAAVVIAFTTIGQAQTPAPRPARPARPPAPAPAPLVLPPEAPLPPAPLEPWLHLDLDALQHTLPDPAELQALQDEVEALRWSLPEPFPAPLVVPHPEPFSIAVHPAVPAPFHHEFDFDFDFDYAQAPGRVAFTADRTYEQARNAIERDQYDRALQLLDKVIAGNSERADAAMYWKAYSQARVARRADALATLGEMQKKFANSPWMKDARALDVEIRQASGQSVAADGLPDEELKLLALRGLMQSDADTALPVIEKILSGTSSARVKEQALFVLSQNRNPKSRAIILGVAKGNGNPELQLRAIRYLGMMGGAENLDALDVVYRGTADEDIKRSILRSFGASRAQDRLLAVAKSESSAALRSEAIQQLGALRATTQLEELYRTETSPDIRRRILQSLAAAGAYDQVATVARTEKDPEVRRNAIRALGASNRSGQTGTNALVSIYGTEQSPAVRRQIVDALAGRRAAKELVDLARAEKDPDLKKAIVSRLSNMREPAARDYMLELLK